MSVNYPLKYINFVKETNKIDLNKDISGKEIKEFYENLTSQDTIKSNIVVDDDDDIIEIEPSLNQSIKQVEIDVNLLNKNEYFKAVQNNDLKTVKSYLLKGFNVNTIDSYGWSGLMIAVCESNIEMVKLLLDFNASYNVNDKAGNDVFKIARNKIINEEVYNLLINHSLKSEYNDKLIDQVSKDLFEYCEKCDTMFNLKEKSSHLTSIVHIINENNKDPDAKIRVMDYHLKCNNKGYQLLMKEGWNQLKGLGSNEQGRIYPIKAIAKYDRLGIGIKSNSKDKYVNKSNILKLKKNNDKPILKSIKEIRKDVERNKIIEKNFRAYLNT